MLLHFDEVRSAYPDPVDEDWVHVRTADGSVLRIRIPFEEFVVQLTRGEGL